jgi:hypothetical protein
LEEFDHHNFHGGSGDVEGFRALLRHKFGNAARGWRLVIAPHGDHLNGGHDYGLAGTKATLYSDFCAGLKKIGFAGNGKSVWNKLSTKSSIKAADGSHVAGVEIRVAWLEDLDPNLAASLDIIADAISEQYIGGAHGAFPDIEREHASRATADEFDRWLVDRDILPEDGPVVRTRQVFECLAISGRGTLTREEFRFLDHWAARRLNRPLPEVPVRTKAEHVPWSPPPPKPAVVPGLEEFREFLAQKFGSPARAWRTALDIKAGGSLSPSEFGMACRQVGWKHPHLPLWNEIASIGGGACNLRGLDPETCTAIDTLVERTLPAFGDLQTLWAEVLDPDGDGICSKLEWVSALKKDLGLRGKAAGLIFTCLDIVHAGWLGFSELGYLEDFVPFSNDMDEEELSGMDSGFLRPSMSTGTLPQQASDPFDMTQLSWGSSTLEGVSGSGLSGSMRRSRMSATSLGHIGSQQRSSRSMQNRQFVNCFQAKYRWQGVAAADRTRSMAEGSAWATLHREVHPSMPTVGGTPLSDVFRSTSEFYREGVRRLEFHKEQQLIPTPADDDSRSVASRKSKASSKGGASRTSKQSGSIPGSTSKRR